MEVMGYERPWVVRSRRSSPLSPSVVVVVGVHVM